MKETLYQVAEAISEAVPHFRKDYFPVVARIHGVFDGEVRTYWPMVGNEDGRSMLSYPHLKKYGRPILRNSQIITRILNDEVGTEIEYKSINILKRFENHKIKATSKADLENRHIYILDDRQVYTYDDINLFLEKLRENQEKIEAKEREIAQQEELIEKLRKEENTAHERGVLTKGLNKLEEQRRILTMQQEEMNQLTRFIRKQGQLRFNPILDPVQSRIKTQNLFNGVTIVIDGGPGTGKTTTMIQRLKYLTDWNAILEDLENGTELYKLTPGQRTHLQQAITNHRDWVFFSPSELLKEYLADAMNREGLTNTSTKVWNWAEYSNKVIRESYLLIDPTNENAHFKASRSKAKLFNNGAAIIDSFNAFFLSQLRAIKTRIPDLDENEPRYKWISIALGIKNKFEGSENFSISQFIKLFSTLEDVYRKDCLELLSENRNIVNKIAKEVLVLSKENPSIYEYLSSLTNVQITEQNEEENEEQEAGENEEELQSENIDDKIINIIRTWFKRYCFSKKKTDVKLTPRQEKLSELLLPILTESHEEQIERVGEIVFFEQFSKYTGGVVSNIFGGFVGKYKQFRRRALSSKDEAWNLSELGELLKRRDGKELHPQEQSLLIGFINNLVKDALRITRKRLNHIFVDAYNDLARPIIGVDEATDFNECDIYAMQSLLYDDYNSMTICGDLMQRLTSTGITSWKSLEPIVKEMKVVDMRTSYRQSSSLIKVAQAMYKDTIGDEPNYKAYMKSTKVPSPLAFVSTDEDDKISWIEKRISEVYVAYGKQLPSIAIFLNNKNEIRGFVDALRDTDFILDSGVEIVDGSEGNVLASKNQIRVYPIDVVKGMEFDVVFFHNIDTTTAPTELIKRYIYVGVSRAAFFLGITLNSDNESITKYFTKDANWARV